MVFIDTHTHFSDEAFHGEEEALLSRALDKGVELMLQADIDSSGREAVYELCERFPKHLKPMLGLYPGSVDANWRDEIDLLPSWLGRNPIAIGEIGLDYHFSTEFKEQQKEALRAQLELALEWKLPVNIHLRDATEDFFSVLEGFRGRGLEGNLHAYSGSYETFVRLQKYGHWKVGIGGVVTFKNATLPEVVRNIPLDMILLETDAPYLAPTPLRGTRNESANIPLIAEKIAGLKGVSLEEVARTSTANAKELFRLAFETPSMF